MKSIDGFPVKECVGCGFCCIQTQCGASLRLYGPVKTCPDLVWKDSRYVCRLMTLDGELGARYRLELYAGEGCCSNLNSWRKEVIPRRDIDLPKSAPYKLDPMFKMFLVSLGGQFMSGDVIALTIYGMIARLKEKNIPEEEIHAVVKEIYYHIKNHRASYQDSFMGEVEELKI